MRLYVLRLNKNDLMIATALLLDPEHNDNAANDDDDDDNIDNSCAIMIVPFPSWWIDSSGRVRVVQESMVRAGEKAQRTIFIMGMIMIRYWIEMSA